MITLYYAKGQCSLAAHLALAEAGVDYDLVPVSFAAAEQRTPQFLALNPKGRVPVLVTDRGVLTENLAILAYVAQAWPQAGLAPTDPFDFARMQAFNAYLSSTLHVAFAHRYRAERWADDPAAQEAMRRKSPAAVAQGFELIETLFSDGRPFVMGETFSVADAYLFVFETWWAERFNDGFCPSPRVEAHRQRMLARPAVQRVLGDEEARG